MLIGSGTTGLPATLPLISACFRLAATNKSHLSFYPTEDKGIQVGSAMTRILP
jgi:hypothetical protein